MPLLGVCLGHQGLGWKSGAQVVHAPEPMHGRVSAVLHEESPLFAGIPAGVPSGPLPLAVRAAPLPEELEPIAWTSDGVLMAVAHRTRPRWGVQFHPESISTEYGRKLLANFGDLTAAHYAADGGARVRDAGAAPETVAAPRRERRPEARTRLTLSVKRLDTLVEAERAFVPPLRRRRARLLARQQQGRRTLALLLHGRRRRPAVGCRHLRRRRAASCASTRNGVERDLEESIFDYLSREGRRLRYLADDLPFDFNCGFVGYLGYELKADCEGSAAHASAMPDAAFVFADRLIAFDHVERTTYVLGCRRARRGRGGRALDPRHEPAARLAAAGRGARLGASCPASARIRR